MGQKEWSIGVFGIITDDQGRILVSRRADGQGWDLPGGGVDLKCDRTLEDTLKREIKEETGLLITSPPALIGVYPDFIKKDLHLFYFVPSYEGQAAPSDEAVEHRFVDFETLRKEIILVWQDYPGHEHGRFWQMLCDGFHFIEALRNKLYFENAESLSGGIVDG